MPIQIRFIENTHYVGSVHVARETRNIDGPNKYAAVFVENEFPCNINYVAFPKYEKWVNDSVHFVHTAGEGLETCVNKALQALTRKRFNYSFENTELLIDVNGKPVYSLKLFYDESSQQLLVSKNFAVPGTFETSTCHLRNYKDNAYTTNTTYESISEYLVDITHGIR